MYRGCGAQSGGNIGAYTLCKHTSRRSTLWRWNTINWRKARLGAGQNLSKPERLGQLTILGGGDGGGGRDGVSVDDDDGGRTVLLLRF